MKCSLEYRVEVEQERGDQLEEEERERDKDSRLIIIIILQVKEDSIPDGCTLSVSGGGIG